MNKILEFITWKKIDNSVMRKNIYTYLNVEEPSLSKYLNTITDIVVRKNRFRGNLSVTIITHNPGYIIGARGRAIHSMVKWLKTRPNVKGKEINVSVKESQLWCNIFRDEIG